VKSAPLPRQGTTFCGCWPCGVVGDAPASSKRSGKSTGVTSTPGGRTASCNPGPGAVGSRCSSATTSRCAPRDHGHKPSGGISSHFKLRHRPSMKTSSNDRPSIQIRTMRSSRNNLGVSQVCGLAAGHARSAQSLGYRRGLSPFSTSTSTSSAPPSSHPAASVKNGKPAILIIAGRPATMIVVAHHHHDQDGPSGCKRWRQPAADSAD
jgi:hypothetical protein